MNPLPLPMACPADPPPAACSFVQWEPGRLYPVEVAGRMAIGAAFGCRHCGLMWDNAGIMLPVRVTG